MRTRRVLTYVRPDDWAGETVVPKKYYLGEDLRVLSACLVGLDLDPPGDGASDLHGPLRVKGVYADATDGRRLRFPADDPGRDFGPLSDDLRPNGHLWLHKHALTPIDELQTPWVSSYGHAPGEGLGQQFALISPVSFRLHDVRMLISRVETSRAARLRATLSAESPLLLHAFLDWLGHPGRFARSVDDGLRAQWLTYPEPHVLWCCSAPEADALTKAIATVLAEDMRADLAAKGTLRLDARDYYRHPRKLLAEHLLDATALGDDGRYLAAAAFLSLGREGSFDFRGALARETYSGMLSDPQDPGLMEGIGLTNEDRARIVDVMAEFGMA